MLLYHLVDPVPGDNSIGYNFHARANNLQKIYFFFVERGHLSWFPSII